MQRVCDAVGVHWDQPMTDHEAILKIRREAADLLEKLDAYELFEAAALMASTLDRIDASITHLARPEPTFGK